jgi:hypothetical protein
MRVIVGLVLYSLAAQTAQAMCAEQLLLFSGSVVDAAGMPMAGAMVGISWSDEYGPAGPAIASTDSEGRYSVQLRFNTYSGRRPWGGGDECRAVLERVSVTAFGGDRQSRSMRLEVDGRTDITVDTLHLETDFDRND